MITPLHEAKEALEAAKRGGEGPMYFAIAAALVAIAEELHVINERSEGDPKARRGPKPS